MSSSQRSALIIDDEREISYLLSQILSKNNFDVNVEYSLAAGIEALRTHSTDLLFLDINLPDGSGVDKLNEIRKSFPSLKIIIISAYDSKSERENALTLGADEFISKPFTNNSINNILNKLFSQDH